MSVHPEQAETRMLAALALVAYPAALACVAAIGYALFALAMRAAELHVLNVYAAQGS
jgi:hypothetical protein